MRPGRTSTMAATAAVALAAATLLLPRPARAHGGDPHSHAHDEPAAVAPVADAWKAESATDRFEALLSVPAGEPGHGPLVARLHLADWATNEPIAGATATLAIPQLGLEAGATADPGMAGAYALDLGAARAGTYAGVLTVSGPRGADLLAFEAIRFGTQEDHADRRWPVVPIAATALGVLAVGALGVLVLRRRAAAPAVLAALALSPAWSGSARAHGDEAHGGAGAAHAPGTVAVLAKDAQFLFGVRTRVVERTRLAARARFPGRVQPRPEAVAEVIAPHAGRTLAASSVLPQVGDHVRAGQPLVELEGILSPEQRVSGAGALADAEARVIAAGEEVRLAEAELARAEALPQIVSRREHEAASARVTSARAALTAARRSAEVLRSSLGGGARSAARTVLVAPISGVVTEAHVALGETAPESHALFRIVDPTGLVVRADVPERDATTLRLAPGAHATILLRVAQGLAVPARFTSSAGSIDAATRTVPTFFEPDDPSRLLEGMLVDVLVATGQEVSGFVVPPSALDSVGGREIVFVHVHAEEFEPRPVATGLRTVDGVEITAGLAPGERVVVSGTAQVRAAFLAP